MSSKTPGRSATYRDPFPTGKWVGPRSANFDGTRFQNEVAVEHRGPIDLVRWSLTRDAGPWRSIEAAPGPPPPREVTRPRVTFVNHASCLVSIPIDGRTLHVLTDPVWGARLGPVSWAGPKRYRPPGIRFEDLPPIDLVLLSHDHYDHLCAQTMRRLAAIHAPTVVTGLGNAALLESLGVARAIELDWWEHVDVGDARVTFVPAQHFSGRGVTDRDRTLWGGLVLEAGGQRIYFAGDTGMGPFFAQIRARLGAPDLALLPIGAFRPEWFMRRIHVGPAEAVEAARVLEARVSVAIHHGTFRLADDGMDEPVERLEAALAALGDAAPVFWVLREGEGRDLVG